MQGPAFLLALEREAWTVARAGRGDAQTRELPFSAADGPESVAAELAGVLREMGWRGTGVCLGLPSWQVYAAAVASGDLPRRRRRQAMVYRLEEQLPLEAERLTVDFLPPRAGQALGVAVETPRTEALLAALAEADIEITCICPTTLLAVWASRDSEADYAVAFGPSTADALRLAGGEPIAWHTVGSGNGEVARCVQADLLRAPPDGDRPARVATLGAPAHGALGPLEDAGLEVSSNGAPSLAATAAPAAQAALAGDEAGWVNLRQGALALPGAAKRLARPARTAALLGAVLLATVAGMLGWRAEQYAHEAEKAEAEQARIYRRLYPNTRVPPDVTSRLRSESARAAGTTGTGTVVPHRPNALNTLRRVLANLPPRVRLRLVDIRIEPTSILIEGEARAHSDAQMIAESLRQGRLAVDTPTTESLATEGVSFTLDGAVPQPEDGP